MIWLNLPLICAITSPFRRCWPLPRRYGRRLYSGYSLLGGGRPFGTFVSPNLFGADHGDLRLGFFTGSVHAELDGDEHIFGLVEWFPNGIY